MSFEFQRGGSERVVIRDAAFDHRPRTEMLMGDIPETLVDEQGRDYSAFFDGHHVCFPESDGMKRGCWLLGTAPVRVRGGGPLDARFLFTFFDHGPTAQRLNALWEFDGSAEEAVQAFVAAGFSRSRQDARFKGDEKGRLHLRTHGNWLTGGDSAHAILHESARARGEIHVGEHNPLRGFGIGFLLHQWEIRR